MASDPLTYFLMILFLIVDCDMGDRSSTDFHLDTYIECEPVLITSIQPISGTTACECAKRIERERKIFWSFSTAYYN